MDYAKMPPAQVRQLIREGKITTQTSGMCDGYAQGNLLVLPMEQAYDFLLFTQRNPKSCPVLEVGDVGSRLVKRMANGGDIATDIPKYRVWEKGVLTGEYTDCGTLVIDGEARMGEEFVEFFPDETALKETVLELFYTPVAEH